MGVINGVYKSCIAGSIGCALGFFDGVHAGHQKLIAVLNEISSEYNLKSMVFTFEKHPLTVIDKERAPKLIMDNETKAEVFKQLGVDIINFHSVGKDFLSTEPEDFLKYYLLDLYNIKAIITGFNFKFGFRGRGDSTLLKKFGCSTGILIRIVEPVCMDGIVVSSTAIRKFIGEGNIKMANKFLGRCYSISGKVIHGKGRGKGIGLPTANISINDDLLYPKNGVYITKVLVDQHYKTGITNIGYNPTFGSNPISIETHIIDYDGNLYNKKIRVDFYDRIRDEITFSNVTDLLCQISRDKYAAVRYFEEVHK